MKAIFITVRTNSTRLPWKSLLEINGQKTIEILINRVKKSKKAELIVLCTTTNPDDAILCDIAKNKGIEWFKGSEEDKLARWKDAAEHFDVDYFITADGDDLFCDPELIDLGFEQEADFLEAEGLICGAFTYGIRTTALNKVCEIKNTDDTEMMWTYFKDTGLFNISKLQHVPEYLFRPEIRMTLDYPEDLLFFTKIIENLGFNASLREIVLYLDNNPDIIKINQFRQEEFLANQKRKTKLEIRR